MQLLDNDILTVQTDWFVTTHRFLLTERTTWLLAPRAEPPCLGVSDTIYRVLSTGILYQAFQTFWGSENDPDYSGYKHSKFTLVGRLVEKEGRPDEALM